MSKPAITFHVVTLFPELIDNYCQTSIIGRGVKAGCLQIKAYNPRDYCLDRYRKVDDTPYGGGAGMVLKPEPIYACVESILAAIESNQPGTTTPIIITSPQGKPLVQADAQAFTVESDIIIICGHYEGFDERIHSLATHEVSLGDFVLTGGELAALCLVDAVGRLIPGVLGQSQSLHLESFNEGINGLLEGPSYTKPPVFRDMEVPEILKSGDHKKIDKWRREQALKRTLERRPDLLVNAKLSKSDKEFLRNLKESL